MPAKQQTSLSIAIVCYNSPTDELCALIDSLARSISRLKQSYDLPSVPIYLIDNSDSEPLSLQQLKDQNESIATLELRLIHGQGNIGYGAAHNLLLSKLGSDFHLMLNPDIVLDEESLLVGVSYLLENPAVTLVSPFAEDEQGQKQFLCKRYPSVLTFLIRGFFPPALKKLFRARLARFEMHELAEDQASVGIPIVSGCFMLCRTSRLKEIGGFDPRYFLYFEDFDLSLRLAQGSELAYLPMMRIKHAGGHAAKKGITHLKMFAGSGIRFFNSHGWRLFRQ